MFFAKNIKILKDLYCCWEEKILMKTVFLCDADISIDVDISILPASTKIVHLYGVYTT